MYVVSHTHTHTHTHTHPFHHTLLYLLSLSLSPPSSSFVVRHFFFSVYALSHAHKTPTLPSVQSNPICLPVPPPPHTPNIRTETATDIHIFSPSPVVPTSHVHTHLEAKLKQNKKQKKKQCDGANNSLLSQQKKYWGFPPLFIHCCCLTLNRPHPSSLSLSLSLPPTSLPPAQNATLLPPPRYYSLVSAFVASLRFVGTRAYNFLHIRY